MEIQLRSPSRALPYDFAETPIVRRLDALVAKSSQFAARRPLHRRLTQSYARALRNEPGARSALKAALLRLLRETEVTAAAVEDVPTLLIEFFEQHPLRDELDRPSLVRSTSFADELMVDVRRWLSRE